MCACGKNTVTHSNSMRSGNTKSCGCARKDAANLKRKPNKGSEVTAVILGYKRHAKERNLVWSVTRKLVTEMISRPCHYCGQPPDNKKTTKNSVAPLLYSGIDRVDNSKGYVRTNIVPCCKQCNRAKGTQSTEQFRMWITKISAMANQWGVLDTSNLEA